MNRGVPQKSDLLKHYQSEASDLKDRKKLEVRNKLKIERDKNPRGTSSHR
jgi:hypothetical protein